MRTKRIRVIQLFKQGLNQKQIAKKEGVGEKTVGVWLKPFKESKKDNANNLLSIENRLKLLLQDKNATPQEIKDLTTAIQQLENRFFN